MSSLRSRVNALRRKMALEYAIVRLWTLADEYCLEWAVAVGWRNDPPDNFVFARRVVSAGHLFPDGGAMHRYLDKCRDRGEIPDTRQLLLTLLPWSYRYTYPAPFS